MQVLRTWQVKVVVFRESSLNAHWNWTVPVINVSEAWGMQQAEEKTYPVTWSAWSSPVETCGCWVGCQDLGSGKKSGTQRCVLLLYQRFLLLNVRWQNPWDLAWSFDKPQFAAGDDYSGLLKSSEKAWRLPLYDYEPSSYAVSASLIHCCEMCMIVARWIKRGISCPRKTNGWSWWVSWG
jgi:hypothetical protein